MADLTTDFLGIKSPIHSGSLLRLQLIKNIMCAARLKPVGVALFGKP